MTGRRRRQSEEKERFWRQVVSGHVASGISVRQYCTDRGVSEPSFFAWRRELARRDATVNTGAKSSVKRVRVQPTSARPAPLRFAQLQIASSESASGACIEIVLPAGIRIRVPRGACQDTLSNVLNALERPTC
jgi:hypothetical protein